MESPTLRRRCETTRRRDDETTRRRDDETTKGAITVFTMYTTDWCGFCARLKAGLATEGIDYLEVDIDRTPEAADVVTDANNGNRTVPTLVFADGSTLTNPSVREVKAKLAV